MQIKKSWARFIKLPNVQKIATLAAALYFACMFIWPIAEYRDWAGVQAVWDRWQSLNVGVLAFSASVIFWYTTHLRSKESDVKEYKAARVFLVFVASELCREFDDAAELLKKRLQSSSWQSMGEDRLAFPQHLYSYLERYIKYAELNNAQYVIDLIKFHQIYTDRLNTVFGDITDRTNPKDCVVKSIGDLCNISARTNRLFGYGRGSNSLDTSKIKPENIKVEIASYRFLFEDDSNFFHHEFFEKYSGDIFEKEKVNPENSARS